MGGSGRGGIVLFWLDEVMEKAHDEEIQPEEEKAKLKTSRNPNSCFYSLL